MNKAPKRGDVFWIDLNPTRGTEINKKRPCLIVSNDSANEASSRIIVAPITSQVTRLFPFEVKINIKGNDSKILLDQIRSIDKIRLLGKRICHLELQTMLLVDKALKISLALS